MVLKMNAKLEFCGEVRKFQRCPNKTLKDYQKTIEEIQDELTPLAERTRDYQFELTELDDEISSIDKHIELSIRYLIHPKKVRIVENEIWLQIIDNYQKGRLNLYKD